jgi:hypothetical protein
MNQDQIDRLRRAADDAEAQAKLSSDAGCRQRLLDAAADARRAADRGTR